MRRRGTDPTPQVVGIIWVLFAVTALIYSAQQPEDVIPTPRFKPEMP